MRDCRYIDIIESEEDFELLYIIKKYLKSEITLDTFRELIKSKEDEVIRISNGFIDCVNHKVSKERRFFINIDSFIKNEKYSERESFLSTENPMIVSCKDFDGQLKVVGPSLAKREKLTNYDLLESGRFYEIKGEFYDFDNGVLLNMRDWYKIISVMPMSMLKEKLKEFYPNDFSYISVVLKEKKLSLSDVKVNIEKEKKVNEEYSHIYNLPKLNMDSIRFIEDGYLKEDDFINGKIEEVKKNFVNENCKKKLKML